MKRTTVARSVIAALCALLITPAFADVEAAKVVFASGEVQVIDVDSRKRFVIKGDLVWAGETLMTRKGRVQVAFTDGGRASLKPNSIYSIADYYYDESEAKPVKSFFELVRGTVRFVSGKIGKRNRANFGIKTKTATIGIRGSSGQVTSCLNASCRGRLDGTYLTTYEGILIIKSGNSSLDVHPNETAFCNDDGSDCVKLEAAPGQSVDSFTGAEPVYEQGEQTFHIEESYEAPAAPEPPVHIEPSPPVDTGGGYHR